MGAKAFAAAVLFLLNCSGTGCGPPMDYSPPLATKIYKAPANGVYELYRRGSSWPVCQAILLRRDPIGFKHDRDGRLVAVAAAEQHPLTEGKYQWRYEGFLGHRPGEPGSHVKFRELLAELGPTIVLGAIAWSLDAVLNAGLHEIDRAIDEQGLTKYQKVRLAKQRAASGYACPDP